MNVNDTSFDKAAQDAAAFQKLVLESVTKAFQAAFKFGPDTAPPEMAREMRAGVFQALTESWDQFMRSPQFLECLRQWMDNAVAMRTMTNEFLGRVRNEVQAPSRSDIDTIMLTVRHMEKRLLDRLDELSAQIGKSNGRTPAPKPAKTGRRARKPRAPAAAPGQSPRSGK